jgi:hypothetical protein
MFDILLTILIGIIQGFFSQQFFNLIGSALTGGA